MLLPFYLKEYTDRLLRLPSVLYLSNRQWICRSKFKIRAAFKHFYLKNINVYLPSNDRQIQNSDKNTWTSLAQYNLNANSQSFQRWRFKTSKYHENMTYIGYPDSICICWHIFFMVNPHYSILRIIKAIVLGVQIFMVLLDGYRSVRCKLFSHYLTHLSQTLKAQNLKKRRYQYIDSAKQLL